MAVIQPLASVAMTELMSGDYLSSDHIGKFNQILAAKTEFRPQEVLLMWNMYSYITPVATKHIQILPSGATERVTHWICTYYDTFQINIYDSANKDMKNTLTSEQLHFIHLLFPDKPSIVYRQVQQQTNAVDCGVYAIAFAVAIANNMDPSRQAFDIASMRYHLKIIFDSNTLTPFPTTSNNETPSCVRKGRPKRVKIGRPPASTQLQSEAKRKKIERAMETETKRIVRLKNMSKYNSKYHKKAKELETEEKRHSKLVTKREKHNENYNLPWKTKENAAFNYNPSVNYENDSCINIGSMSVVCNHCQALKWKGETSGMCCSNGKVKLDPLTEPPEPLKSLLLGSHPQSKEFLKATRSYNNAFQMTSFGGNIISEGHFMPTFKVQGQVYHLAGSLLPQPNQDPKYLQIYFMGDEVESEAILRSNNFKNLNLDIIQALQKMLHLHNNYIRSFKAAMERQTHGNFRVIIHADKKPRDEHKGRYNTPTVNEVAIVIVGQEFEKRDIVLHSREKGLLRVSEIHRSYDALQYPLMFVTGEDGYCINISQYEINTQKSSRKTVSAMNFYAYRLMTRSPGISHLHYFRQLLNQYWVDMYAKIETERLSFIRNNKNK